MHNSMRNYELLRNLLSFVKKSEENNNLTKYSHCLTVEVARQIWRATVNLPKLVCAVKNVLDKTSARHRAQLCSC